MAPSVQRHKVWQCPLLECRAVTLPRRGTCWNYLGCSKLTKQSQPLVGRSSPYCGDMWRRYCSLTSFFPIVDTCLSCEEEASKVGLFINPDKCKVMTTSAWNDRSDIQVEERDLELVSDFCYLGSYISFNGSCEKDVKVHIGKAATVFGKMKKIWRSNKISLEVKMRLYESIILSALLYGA